MDSTFLTRVCIRNYKSIGQCDVGLGPLTFLVGPNGAGKSNFIDALRFVADSLRTTERGHPYSPTVDQPALSQLMSLELARRAKSFDKLCREVERLLKSRTEP